MTIKDKTTAQIDALVATRVNSGGLIPAKGTQPFFYELLRVMNFLDESTAHWLRVDEDDTGDKYIWVNTGRFEIDGTELSWTGAAVNLSSYSSTTVYVWAYNNAGSAGIGHNDTGFPSGTVHIPLAKVTITSVITAIVDYRQQFLLNVSSKVDTIGGLTPTDSNIIVGNGTTWVAESGSTARTSLGAAASGANADITSFTGLDDNAVPVDKTAAATTAARGSVKKAAVDADITDSSGGTPSSTIAAMTNTDTLTDSTTGTADDTVANVGTAVTGVDGSGSNAASKADVDTRLTAINNNFKELVDQEITQEALNTAVINAIASLATETNDLKAKLRTAGTLESA